MAILAKTLLSAVTAQGAGTGQDLAAMVRSVTMQVTTGGVTPDPQVQVRLEGSLDNSAWFGMGTQTGAGQLSVDQDVVQYVRGYVASIASGNVTALLAFVAG